MKRSPSRWTGSFATAGKVSAKAASPVHPCLILKRSRRCPSPGSCKDPPSDRIALYPSTTRGFACRHHPNSVSPATVHPLTENLLILFFYSKPI
jgi:hypothetical protein